MAWPGVLNLFFARGKGAVCLLRRNQARVDPRTYTREVNL